MHVYSHDSPLHCISPLSGARDVPIHLREARRSSKRIRQNLGGGKSIIPGASLSRNKSQRRSAQSAENQTATRRETQNAVKRKRSKYQTTGIARTVDRIPSKPTHASIPRFGAASKGKRKDFLEVEKENDSDGEFEFAGLMQLQRRSARLTRKRVKVDEVIDIEDSDDDQLQVRMLIDSCHVTRHRSYNTRILQHSRTRFQLVSVVLVSPSAQKCSITSARSHGSKVHGWSCHTSPTDGKRLMS